MYKKWVSCVQLVCVLSCIFSMLFLNTLSVRAATSFSNTYTIKFPSTAEMSDGAYNGGTSQMFHYTLYYAQGYYDMTLTASPQLNWSNVGLARPSHDKYVTFYLAYLNLSTDVGSISDLYYTDSENNILGTTSNGITKDMTVLAQELDLNGYFCYPVTAHFKYYFDKNATGGYANNNVTANFTFSGSVGGRLANASEIEIAKVQVKDIGTQQKLDTLNQTETDTNQTTHSIFDSISAFFGSFFSNLIGVFVPEDGFFTTWFNNLNTLLEAKLGILYYPFAKIIYFLNNLTTAFGGSANASITFPALQFTNQATGETYTFLSAQTVNLNDYNLPLSSSANSSLVGTSGYNSLIDIVRTFNGFVIVMLLLALLRQKLNLILRGDDNDS